MQAARELGVKMEALVANDCFPSPWVLVSLHSNKEIHHWEQNNAPHLH